MQHSFAPGGHPRKPTIMKPVCIALLMGLLGSFLACKKDSGTPAFDYQRVEGVWVPYEYIDGSGIYQPLSIQGSSVFGVYAESVKLNTDRTFIPVTWIDSANYTLKLNEQGTYEYLSDRNVFAFNNVRQFEMHVSLIQGQELWLTNNGEIYKYRKIF
jgi:hypothetical protein